MCWSTQTNKSVVAEQNACLQKSYTVNYASHAPMDQAMREVSCFYMTGACTTLPATRLLHAA